MKLSLSTLFWLLAVLVTGFLAYRNDPYETFGFVVIATAVLWWTVARFIASDRSRC